MQSIKPDILPIFVSFRRDTALQQSQQETAEAAPVNLLALRRCPPRFHPPDRRGQLARGTVFETDGEPWRC